MCNLYRLASGPQEVARLFGVEADHGINVAGEVYPGYPGLVIADGRARAMNWGFPLVLKSRQGQRLKPKPVTNARDDKLLTGFWRDSFIARRCLIPATQWAEPQGQAGRMTRTWYAIPETPVMVIAGLWRASAEWGDVFTMVMVESAPQMAEVHDRMPVILSDEDRERWTGGTVDEALSLCRTWEGDLAANHSGERWVDGKSIVSQPSLL